MFIHFPTSTLEQAVAHGKALSKFFSGMLPSPHELAYEKTMMPLGLYKKKMYIGAKHEDDKVELMMKGVTSARRDNSMLIRDTVVRAQTMLFMEGASQHDVVQFCGQAMARVHNSAVCVHDGAERDFDGRFALKDFLQSAGIKRDMASYKSDNSAILVAKAMLAENPLCGVGKGSRVVFVIAQKHKAKRCEQAMLLETCQARRARLDQDFYVEALTKKIVPMISILFKQQEAASRVVKDPFGRLLTLNPKTVADQKKIVGETTALKALEEVFRKCRLVQRRQELQPPPEAPAAKQAKVKDKTAEHTQGIEKFFRRR